MTARNVLKRQSMKTLLSLPLVLGMLLSFPGMTAFASATTAKFKQPRSIELFTSAAVVMDSHSTAHVVDVNASQDLVYRRIPRGGAPSAALALFSHVAISDEDPIKPQLAIDSHDLLHLLWQEEMDDGQGCSIITLYYASFAADTTPSLANRMQIGSTSTSCGEPIMSLIRVEPSGRTHIIWNDRRPGAPLLHITIINSVVSPVHTFTPSGSLLDFNADSNGVAHLAYVRASASDYHIDYRTITADGVTSTPVEDVIAPPSPGMDEGGSVLSVLVTPAGITHLISYASTDQNITYYDLVLNQSGARVRSYPIIGGGFFSQPPAAALDKQGRLHVVADESVEAGTDTLRYAVYADGKRQSRRTLATTTGVVRTFALGLGPDGKPTIVWSLSKPGKQAGSYKPADVYTLRPSSSSTPNISREAPTDDRLVALALDPQGGAVAVWRVLDNSPEESTPGVGRFASTYD